MSSGKVLDLQGLAALLGEVSVLAGERVARPALLAPPRVLHVRQSRLPVLGQPDASLRHVKVVLKCVLVIMSIN